MNKRLAICFGYPKREGIEPIPYIDDVSHRYYGGYYIVTQGTLVEVAGRWGHNCSHDIGITTVKS